MFKTLYDELIYILVDIKNFFIGVFGGIVEFLTKYFSIEVLTVFGIMLLALLLIFIFTKIINK